MRVTTLVAVAVLAPASALVANLDAAGVDAVMLGRRATVVKFVTGKPDETETLDQLWRTLETELASSGLGTPAN